MNTKLILTLAATLFAATLPASAQARKPISKVPFIITKPGTYYLTKDLTLTQPLPAGVSAAIDIRASDVTLDLNGRSLASTVPFTQGISNDGTGSRIKVLNGTVRGFGLGIFLTIANEVSGLEVERVAVEKCQFVGIWLDGRQSSVRRCRVADIGGGDANNQHVQGIRIDKEQALVEDCQLTGFTREQATYFVTAIECTGATPVIRRNQILGGFSNQMEALGIKGGSGLVADNQLQGWTVGISMSTGAYRDNGTTNCATKFQGGNNAGGNQ